MKPPHHHIVSAVFVVIAGTIATQLAMAAAWIRGFDKTRSHE